MDRIGKAAIMVTMAIGTDLEQPLTEAARESGFLVCKGQIGSMDTQKIVAAIETAARREGIVHGVYGDEHALYHVILEALHGVYRGPFALGNLLRTVGLSFAILRGPRTRGDANDREWIALCLYGSIGAPVKGWEHEVIGLGINHF
ncbi:MAG: hut operon transcriptional regulator HutP [Chloroflexi bacterium]|nr:hut operon transcriptional regulator HutP [Chloroflexota bacterium]MCL5075270.1 hut operon transcriptional regulator HutP [Chloroflexota bacterium]